MQRHNRTPIKGPGLGSLLGSQWPGSLSAFQARQDDVLGLDNCTVSAPRHGMLLPMGKMGHTRVLSVTTSHGIANADSDTKGLAVAAAVAAVAVAVAVAIEVEIEVEVEVEVEAAAEA